MTSFKQAAEAEFEGPSTLIEHLPPHISSQSCDDLGQRPIGLAFRCSKAFITFAVCMAVFTDAYLYTMIIPILPDMLTKNAGVAPEDIQYWTSILLSTFGVANLSISPYAGYIADQSVTRRTPLLLGLYALTASTVLFCFGKSPAVLVIARGLQGASTSVIWVVGLALLSDTMGVSNSGGAMGWQGIGRFAGMLLGPSLSGVVYQSSGHYAVFGMGFAVLILDIILRFVMIERKVAERWISFNDTSTSDDIDPTQPLLKAYDGPRDLSLDRAETFRNVTAISSRPSVTEVLDSQVMAIVPLLSSIRILAALSTYFTCAILTTALESVLSLYTMELFNWTAAESGLIFVMLSFSIIIDPFIGRLTDAHGCRGITVSGLALGIVVWIAMCFVTTNTTAAKIILFILIFVVGFSTALMVTPNMVEISRAVDAISQSSLAGKSDPSKVMGRAYSLLNMSWGLGSIIGPLWGGSIIQEWGWVVMCSSFVVLQSFSTVFAFRYAGERLDDEDEEDEI